MRKVLILAVSGLAGLLVVAPILGVLALTQLSPFEGLRRQALERGLSLYWGEAVTIAGPVEVSLWPRLIVSAADLASTTDGTSPARAGRLHMLFARWTRLPFEPPLFALGVSDARFQFALTTQSDAAPGSILSSPVALFSVLPRLRLTNAVFDVAAPDDGWQFTLEVDRVISRLKNGVETLDADARLNGRPFAFHFQFDREPNPAAPGDRPYGAILAVTSGGIEGRMTTQSASAAFDDDLTMAVSASTTSIADLLSIAGLARTVDGTATVSGDLHADPQRLSLRNLVLDARFSGGTTTRVTGSIADLSDWSGVDISAQSDLTALAAQDGATSPRDIAITRLAGRFRDGAEGLMLTDATVDTNAFSQSLQEIGPLRVEAIRRGEDGVLSLNGISVRGRPGPDPLFRLHGDIRDALDFAGISLEGTFDLPVSDILSVPAAAQGMLGRLSGSAALSDARGSLEIERLTAEVKGGALTATVAIAPPQPGTQTPGGVAIKLNVPRLGPLLSALGTPAAFDGPLTYEGTFSHEAESASAKGALVLGGTDLKGTLTASRKNTRFDVTGELTSSRIEADQVFALFEGIGDVSHAPKVRIAGASLAQDAQLPDLAHRTDMDLTLKAQRVQGVGRAATGLTARLRMDDGNFRADPVSLSLGAGHIKGVISPSGDGRFAAKGSGDGWPLSDLMGPSAPFAVSGSASFVFDVTGGIAQADPLRTLDGTVTARVHDGRLGTGMLDLAGLGLLGGMFNPAVLSGETRLRCATIPLRFERGVARTAPAVVLETEHVEAEARGTVDFVRHTIDLAVMPRPLHSGADGYPFTISGSLDTPKIAMGGGKRVRHSRRAAACRT